MHETREREHFMSVHQVEINLGKMSSPSLPSKQIKTKRKKSFNRKRLADLGKEHGCPGEGIVREFETSCSHCYI